MSCGEQRLSSSWAGRHPWRFLFGLSGWDCVWAHPTPDGQRMLTEMNSPQHSTGLQNSMQPPKPVQMQPCLKELLSHQPTERIFRVKGDVQANPASTW